MSEISKYLAVDEVPFYINKFGQKRFRGVKRFYGDTVRNDKAAEQADMEAVEPQLVYQYVNEIIELFRKANGFAEPLIRKSSLILDGTEHEIADNGIIVRGCNWEAPYYDKKSNRYTKWDSKYDEIARVFDLKKPSDLVWLKFTKNKHLGVVAKSFDINYSDSNSSGILVNEVKESWDDTYVYIFPLTSEILGNYSTGDLELAIGNYLIEKKVPIIDYYSHYN